MDQYHKDGMEYPVAWRPQIRDELSYNRGRGRGRPFLNSDRYLHCREDIILNEDGRNYRRRTQEANFRSFNKWEPYRMMRQSYLQDEANTYSSKSHVGSKRKEHQIKNNARHELRSDNRNHGERGENILPTSSSVGDMDAFMRDEGSIRIFPMYSHVQYDKEREDIILHEDYNVGRLGAVKGSNVGSLRKKQKISKTTEISDVERNSKKDENIQRGKSISAQSCTESSNVKTNSKKDDKSIQREKNMSVHSSTKSSNVETNSRKNDESIQTEKNISGQSCTESSNVEINLYKTEYSCKELPFVKIINTNKPDDILLFIHVKEIVKAISEKLHSFLKNNCYSEAVPFLTSYSLRKGVLVYYCENEYSCNWLVENFNEVRINDRIILEVIACVDSNKAVLKMKDVTQDPKQMLRRLRRLVPELLVEKWKLTNTNYGDTGKEFCFEIDRESLKIITEDRLIRFETDQFEIVFVTKHK
ncbi:hypothetical protein C0J52_16619 [Blattella germanica]|nr:hypothetical protein C0J52_16619 [Blattella germanica]PSN34425.1 hypothetical protein C0J52_16619 [Blattella germanica]PSN34426.1 hypothetical protein C0J52_16619 [Blattella germanica]